MAVYTKTGDRGETGTLDGRISKTSLKIETIGAIDELNSFLGIVGGLTEVQRDLFTINSILAGSKLRFPKTKTKKLEKQIDKWEAGLPAQKNFIIYGGTTEATHLFYARALVRRAERILVNYAKTQSVKEGIMIYVNRLSDYLFMLARHKNFTSGQKTEYWKPRRA